MFLEDPMKSSTSLFDYTSSLFLSSKSSKRSWDCSRVGLGLIDSLRDENKNILLGSQLKLLKNSSSKNHYSSFGDEQTEVKNPIFSSFSSSKSELDEIGKINSFEFVHCFMDCLSASEDYTRIISHGPNPKTTHIFGDCILESSMIESHVSKGGFQCIVKSSENLPPNDFLSFCCFCNKKLGENRDIYMYRGEKAFCSCNCRDQAILIDEESKLERHDFYSSDSSIFHEELFMEGLEVSN